MNRYLLILLCVLFPSVLMAQNNALPAAPHLLLKGHAAQRYVPDRFTIHLSVDVVDKAPSIARSKVEAHVNRSWVR
jgi:uncharacterized protein YggE